MKTSMLLLIALTLTMSGAMATSVDGMDSIVKIGGDSKVTVPDIDEDLTTPQMTTSLSKFMKEDKADGLPLNQSKLSLNVGSSVKYDRVAQYNSQRFFTPAELAAAQNESA